MGEGERGREGGREGEREVKGERDSWRGGLSLHTIIFFPLNSSMMHDLPTSCPAPLCSEERMGVMAAGQEEERERLTEDGW